MTVLLECHMHALASCGPLDTIKTTSYEDSPDSRARQISFSLAAGTPITEYCCRQPAAVDKVW